MKNKLFPEPYIPPFPFHLFVEGEEERNKSKNTIRVYSAELAELRKTKDINRTLRLLQSLKPTAKRKGSKYHFIYRSIFGFSKPKPSELAEIPSSPYSFNPKPKSPNSESSQRETWEKMEIYYFHRGRYLPAPIKKDGEYFMKLFGNTREQALYNVVSWYFLPSFREEVRKLLKKYRSLLSESM
jgi:hypothetical protein